MPSEVSTVDVEQSIEELRRELAEAREQQAATAGILAAISNSPTDAQGIFAEIAASAARLCDAYDAGVLQRDGDQLRLLGRHGTTIPVLGPIGHPTLRLTRGVLIARAVLDRQTLHAADLQAETVEFPEGSELARRLGHRTILAVPLIRGGEAIGAIYIRRTEVRPFTNRQIELLKTFADQAVIAIENARLFEAEQTSKRELLKSFEQQTATSQILEVISRSPTHTQPVFDAIVASGLNLFASDAVLITLPEGNAIKAAAVAASDPARADAIRNRFPVPLTRDYMHGIAILDKKVIDIPDAASAPLELSAGAAAMLPSGNRAITIVPLMRGESAIGALSVLRLVPGSLTPNQLGLLETFADQAVIAIENTRLFEEVQVRTRDLTEALEQQTATSEVLAVISRSKFDLQPVMDTLVEAAARLCDADAWLFRREGNAYRWAASYGFSMEQHERIKAYFIQKTFVPDRRGMTSMRAAFEGRPVHIPDVLADPEYTHTEAQEIGGFRSTLGVPLLRDGVVMGVLALTRPEVRPFTDKQIELITTFADQAVIAIENTRLFEAEQASKLELQESLEQQTATSDVLRAISSSPGELKHVFEAMLTNAMRICKAQFGHLLLFDGAEFQAAHLLGVPQTYREIWERGPVRPSPNNGLGRIVRTKQVVHIPDITADVAFSEGDPLRLATVELTGARTFLAVPMLKDGQLIGAIVIYRQEVRPFTGKQIELLTSFAAQAVIAIENGRLLNELRESLQQQTATADVLKVISRSTFDLPKVLDALVESAATLCDSYDTAILQKDGAVLRIVAHRGHIPSVGAVGAGTIPLMRGATVGRAVLDRQTIHLADAQSATDEYPEGSAIARRLGFRTLLTVPLLAGNEAVGAITLRRSEVRPFTDRQIELLQTFADQAVIAIENARLFEEVQARTRELAKTVEDLEIASQHKSQFVANMSHELRTPLAAILGYAELMQEGFYESLGQKSLDALTRIRSNGKHLLGLIDTVLDIAKIESGQFTLNMAEYAIESVVETVRSATESLAQNKRLALKTEVAKSLPIGHGDEQRLTQVLLNLVGNAIKFTDRGEVRVTAKAVDG